jgi:hypothetical protein
LPSASKALSSEAPLAAIASSPASVTIAIRTSSGVDGGGYTSDLRFRKTRIFLRRGLGRWNRLDPAQEIRFYAQICWMRPRLLISQCSPHERSDMRGSIRLTGCPGYRLAHPATLSDSMQVYRCGMDDPNGPVSTQLRPRRNMVFHGHAG